MVEFSLIALLLLLLTLGMVDFGHAWYQWNSAEKATQVGVRAAVISDPVAVELADFDCDNGSIALGTPCRDPGASTFGTIVCDGSTSTCSGGNTFSPDALALILAPMQKVYPRVQASNVIVEYIDVRLGFAGREAPVPEVRVSLTGLTFNYAFLGGLLGFSNITMPDFHASLVGEDLSSAGTS
jgi:hypothetical protein